MASLIPFHTEGTLRCLHEATIHATPLMAV